MSAQDSTEADELDRVTEEMRLLAMTRDELRAEVRVLRGQPWPWQDQAFAYLGFCRDRMPSEHVTVVQNFINSSRATKSEKADG